MRKRWWLFGFFFRENNRIEKNQAKRGNTGNNKSRGKIKSRKKSR